MQGELTVAMIVKDEERDLPGCLESIRALGSVVREVCIYDTGSTDRTVELAEAWGARVQRGYWDDDFGRAKNAAIDMATTRWVLVLDADDRIYSTSADLGHLVTEANRYADAWRWGIAIDVDDVRNGVKVGSAPGQRIIQPRTMKYRNRLHEVVVLREDGASPRWASAAHSTARIEHLGYVEDPSDRGIRNTRIGDLEVSEARNAGNLDRLAEALTHRGRSRSMGGDFDGAIQDWLEVRSLRSASPHRTFAGERLVDTWLDRGQLDDVGRVLGELLEEGLNKDLVNWLRTRMLEAQGEYIQALELIRTVQAPTSTFLERKSAAAILLTRARLASLVGQQEEAISALVGLATRPGEATGVPDVLLRAWADRPLSVLTQVLYRAGGDRVPFIANEFETCGPAGATIAQGLRAAQTRGGR